VTASQALAEARRRDVDHRRQQVRQALAEMRAQAAQITISSVAGRAGVHRSFIHRHPDLRAAVIAAAEDPATSSPSGAGTASRRSLLADNANLRERNHRLEHHARDSNSACPNCSAPRSASAPGSAPPTTQPPSANRPAACASRSSTCARHSANATTNSPRPAKPTGG
jgi:Family of unknown function (DUF6262)